MKNLSVLPVQQHIRHHIWHEKGGGFTDFGNVEITISYNSLFSPTWMSSTTPQFLLQPTLLERLAKLPTVVQMSQAGSHVNQCTQQFNIIVPPSKFLPQPHWFQNTVFLLLVRWSDKLSCCFIWRFKFLPMNTCNVNTCEEEIAFLVKQGKEAYVLMKQSIHWSILWSLCYFGWKQQFLYSSIGEWYWFFFGIDSFQGQFNRPQTYIDTNGTKVHLYSIIEPKHAFAPNCSPPKCMTCKLVEAETRKPKLKSSCWFLWQMISFWPTNTNKEIVSLSNISLLLRLQVNSLLTHCIHSWSAGLGSTINGSSVKESNCKIQLGCIFPW